MKHIKLFENKIVDDILDKISEFGKESLTKYEKEFLQNFQKKDTTDIETKIKSRKNKVKGIFDYDPREDKEFFNQLGDEIGVPMDFSNFDDEEIEEEKYAIIYDNLEDSDIEHFTEIFNVTDIQKQLGVELVYKPWDELSDETKQKFKKYTETI